MNKQARKIMHYKGRGRSSFKYIIFRLETPKINQVPESGNLVNICNLNPAYIDFDVSC